MILIGMLFLLLVVAPLVMLAAMAIANNDGAMAWLRAHATRSHLKPDAEASRGGGEAAGASDAAGTAKEGAAEPLEA